MVPFQFKGFVSVARLYMCAATWWKINNDRYFRCIEKYTQGEYGWATAAISHFTYATQQDVMKEENWLLAPLYMAGVTNSQGIDASGKIITHKT